MRQAGKGKSIQGGVSVAYKYQAAHFKFSIYANGTKIDSKNQYYPPPGSVNADRAAKYSGKILQFRR